MAKFIAIIGFLAAIAIINHALAANLTISSKIHQSVLIELYTSEGCNSCPPADRWLSHLKNDPRLWKQIVPVAFHVDYWNSLGWQDRFSDTRFSKRQSIYERLNYLHTSYTPAVMKNGREWRDWHYLEIPTSAGVYKAGILKAIIRDKNVETKYTPYRRYNSPLVLNVALLGINLSTPVIAGENAGRILQHDFVVLDFQQFRQSPQDGRFRWRLPNLLDGISPSTSALALWVTTIDDPTPLQSTGGWLK